MIAENGLNELEKHPFFLHIFTKPVHKQNININNAYCSAFQQLIKALCKTKIDGIKYKAKCKQEIQAKSKNIHVTKELEQVRFEFFLNTAAVVESG